MNWPDTKLYVAGWLLRNSQDSHGILQETGGIYILVDRQKNNSDLLPKVQETLSILGRDLSGNELSKRSTKREPHAGMEDGLHSIKNIL